MTLIAFILGVVVGVPIGVFVLALCKVAGDD
jgi:hypothetical protein